MSEASAKFIVSGDQCVDQPEDLNLGHAPDGCVVDVMFTDCKLISVCSGGSPKLVGVTR